ncbi:twin-arginine translocase TatA/TatE family subunit [Pseudomonas sp. PA-3-11C]|uniref:twin-arginine translocase TatA/TatE family subunit n=1 Tax=unclassified Pseudomonas TaxID=196821 RepID=UPI001F191413|nr:MULTISPECIES: twin-arginine translocase TatA/TatE family subunit [unclassified Pseudomonas]MCF5511510.1 twin-arginine translocase TatA/TatE family subunit [Pseudomonas sp. PA-3-6H]MCF5517929.1 twin-arginine translocase TatA/TatE family subunit [Pseudomonas sp. PA-3-6E]MCF5560802.1 twin-arginine translocase TatA/TatE family subunit [Pseudomonas sp. PA-3-5D]MCF5569998.1 twin-arginine translocase TatA/TatE family subunit [Pseudomonas sp. PA-3-11C]MCF5593576.1 twin-arginine translocase TatA/Tat
MGVFDWKHWLVLLLVVAVLFGSKRLKNLGADLGETIKGFRRSVNSDEAQPSVVTSARVESDTPQTQQRASSEAPLGR